MATAKEFYTKRAQAILAEMPQDAIKRVNRVLAQGVEHDARFQRQAWAANNVPSKVVIDDDGMWWAA